MMTHIRTIRSMAVGAALVLAVSACDNDITELNRNPNSPDSATPEYLFANATEAAVSRVFGADLHMDITALWVQHYAEHRYSTEDRYEISDSKVSTHFTGFYAGPLQDFEEAIHLAEDGGRPSTAAVARILQQWTFSVVTDLWGDIGYSQALKGRDPSAPSTPAYDPQSEVYEGLMSTLRSSQAALNAAEPGFGGADLIYGGDVAKWRRFANSLRLRLAMRLSEANENLGRTEFAEALADGVFESNSDNALLTYIEGGNLTHPIFSYERTRDDHSVSATLVDTLKSLADPRLPIYAKPTAEGDYVGMENGSEAAPALTAISKIGTLFSKADASAYVLTYPEVLLLQAEAAERGWTGGDPAALYEAGIRASMEMVGVPTSEIDDYLTQPAVQYQGGDAGLTQIALQKWIALYGNGVEAWSEWRRTGVPQLTAGPDALNGGNVPVRLPYPSREASLNAANLQAAIDRQGGATLNSPIWWMP